MLNWRLVAIPASILPFIILFLTTKVSPADVFSVGILPFAMAAGVAVAKNLLQAVRFKYFIRRFIGHDVSSTGKTIAARLAGEFVTSTTPSYVGGEFVRIAWMAKHGVPAGKAAWVATMEIIADVFVGSMLAFIAGAFAIARGGTAIGVIVILVTIPAFVLWLLLVLLSAKRTLQLPSFSIRLLQKFLAKDRASSIIQTANSAIADLCQMSRENFSQRKSIQTFAVGLAITLGAVLCYGASFMILADSVGSKIGLFDSLMATSASTSVANLPITIGGSALTEFGIWAYLSNFSGIPDFSHIVNDSHLKVIIAWRIASYHVPLGISWIALMRLAADKGKAAAAKPGSHKGAQTDRVGSPVKSRDET